MDYCYQVLNDVFIHREFGAKVFNMKALLKSVPGVFEHSDKNVRAEVRAGHLKHRLTHGLFL